jgi:predicted DNA repair protein MutK
MSSGLLSLLDDIVAITKVATSSLDDVAGQAAKAGSKAISKAAGIVIDDAAVTPRYVVGFAAERELPIVTKIALGSLKNKVLILLPGAVLLNIVAPWIVVPLLMIGGVYLCLEGYEKVAGLLKKETAEEGLRNASNITLESEEVKVAGAVRTDFILSAEIMAITLSTVADSHVWLQILVLLLVGLGMTLLVYGAVAIIVKADDFGVALARSQSRLIKVLGRMIVLGMPIVLQILSTVGMVAMLWVGGGIVIHGLHEFGIQQPEEWIKSLGAYILTLLPIIGGTIHWCVTASCSAGVGVIVGSIASRSFRLFSSQASAVN